MKALSIRQPWAWAILHAGKDVENRDWQPRNPALRFRGPVLIHASSGMTRAEWENFLYFAHDLSVTHPFPEGLTLPSLQDLPRGGIVGRAVVSEIIKDSSSPWFFGPLALVLDDVKPLPFTPCKGALGFFDVPETVLQQLRYDEATRRVLAVRGTADAPGFEACVNTEAENLKGWLP